MKWPLDTNDLVLSVLAIATLAFILEATGFLPRWISRYLNKNKHSQTLDILRDLGVDVATTRKVLIGAKIKSFFGRRQDYVKETNKRLEAYTFSHRVRIGRENRSDFSVFT